MPAMENVLAPVGAAAPETSRTRPPDVRRARRAHILLALLGTIITTALFSVAVTDWSPLVVLLVALVAVGAAWVSGGAATALIGAVRPVSPFPAPPGAWVPARRTALVMTLCGEESAPVAAYLKSLHAALRGAGLGETTRIVVLSDTSDPARIAQEENDLAPLIGRGLLSYRRRSRNEGRKPGNIAEWVEAAGADYEYMLVLDADSRMTAARIRAMIWRMEMRPDVGLLQAGIALAPGRTHFGRHQRLTARLLSPNFLSGFAAWTGETGNYWGHNALVRLAAFRAALDLPVLPGAAPFGGPILSHDFVEAAWIRRAGWGVEVDPQLGGSFEDAPQSLGSFSRRDRRWCQGNLQHIALLAEPGLHAVSRAHLALGILSYLAAPIWLTLLVLLTSGLAGLHGAWPLLAVAGLLLAPKLCAMPRALARARTLRRRTVVLRAFAAELALSAVLAPIIMVRQAGAVLEVLLGRDCGWKRPVRRRGRLPGGAAEAAVGLGLCALAVGAGTGLTLWLAPVILPLVLAPVVVRLVDAPA